MEEPERLVVGTPSLEWTQTRSQIVDPFEIALSRKVCKRSLNPAGVWKTRSSPVITSILRVVS